MEIEVECPACGRRITIVPMNLKSVQFGAYCKTDKVIWVADVETVTRVKSLTEMSEYYRSKGPTHDDAHAG